MWKLGISLALALAISAGSGGSREEPSRPQFKYVGGTENVPESCEGNLELGPTVLTFRCSQGSATVPYEAIRLMQYRPDISRQVHKMKLKWKVKPELVSPIMGGKRNRYFTIVYGDQGKAHALVLDVSPQAMRPYLAEIDLKSGKRVEVKSFEEYE